VLNKNRGITEKTGDLGKNRKKIEHSVDNKKDSQVLGQENILKKCNSRAGDLKSGDVQTIALRSAERKKTKKKNTNFI